MDNPKQWPEWGCVHERPNECGYCGSPLDNPEHDQLKCNKEAEDCLEQMEIELRKEHEKHENS
jgi:hypothetical protein